MCLSDSRTKRTVNRCRGQMPKVGNDAADSGALLDKGVVDSSS